MCVAFGDRLVEQQARLIWIAELVSKSQPAAILAAKPEVSLIAPLGD